MRKLKHIGNYLVVGFSTREIKEWGTTLGEYGVIDKELYTGNLDVDKSVLEFDGIDSIEEAIEQAKSLAFPKEPEHITTPPAPSRPHFPQIGEVLQNGYTVDAAYCVGKDRYVLAHRDGAPEPYVVWDVDQDGDTVNGRYFVNLIRAQQRFTSYWLEKYQNNKPLEFSAYMRSEIKRMAKITASFEKIIDEIEDVFMLHQIVHFWWERNSHHVSAESMETTLALMYHHFLENRQIL